MNPAANDEALTESLVDLSPSNKETLLETARKEILLREAEANTILAGLKQLNPTIAEQFHPKQTTIAGLTLRMIRSPPPASGVKVTVPSFIAISYCWHYPLDWTLAPAAQASKLRPGWEISQPMAKAVLSLRTSTNEGVWLDKLCIKQSDESEKAVTIGAMDVIYRSARQMAILLEDVQLDAAEQMAAKTYAGFCEDMRQLIVKNGLQGEAKMELIRSNKYFKGFKDELDEGVAQKLWEDSRRFVKKLLTARWFSRAWCAHECRIAVHPAAENTPIIFCFGAEGQVIPFEFRFITYHAHRLNVDEQSTYSISQPRFNDTDPFSIEWLFLRIQKLNSKPVDIEISLMQYLEGIVNLDCSKKEDMVSIALNTALLPLIYRGHLNTCEEVIWVMALLTLASGDVQPLVMEGTKLKGPEVNGTRTIVSWVAKPQVLTIAGSNRIPHIDRRSIMAVTKEYIELDILLFIDLPKKPSQASMEKSSALTKAHSLEELNHYLSIGGSAEVQGAHNYLQSHSLSPDFIQTWLALALDCGIDWIKRLPSVLIEQTVGWSHWGQFTDNSLFPVFRDKLEAAAIDLLSLFGKNEKNTPDFTTNYLNPTVKFFECLIDSRLKVLTQVARRLCLGNSDWAITNRVSNKSWIAVPTAVAHLPLWQTKAWVIEPFDPAAPPERPEDYWPPDLTKERDPNVAQEDIWPVMTSDNASRRAPRNDERATWRLRRKQVIFGCEPIVPDGKSVILLRNQKVYGAEDYDLKAMIRARFGNRAVPPFAQGVMDGKSVNQILDENKKLLPGVSQ
jgi:hypothetical protein